MNYEDLSRLDTALDTGGRPLVSVITVVYNNAKTLDRCIRSVLNQTYKNIEYIVIDGGSTDGTLEVIQRYKEVIDHFISEPDDGLYHAMNKGLKIATGEYIAFLNSDDYFLADAVSASIENILTHNLDISYAGFLFADENGHAVIADEGREWNDSMLVQGIPGGHETIFARKECYDRIGGYDLTYKLAADYHWVMRAYKAGFKAAPLRKTILVMAPGGLSFDQSLEKTENYRLLRENFGDLSSEILGKLYQLKFHKNWYGCTMSDMEMLNLLSEAKAISDELYHALFLTIENRKRKLKGTITPAKHPKAGKLKIAIALTFLTNVSGGAERIAIEMANELKKRGHAVTMVCCHGVAGEPYYSLDRHIPYIDIAIPPYKQHYENLGKNLNLKFDEWSERCFEQLEYDPTKGDFDAWCKSGGLWRAQMYYGFLQEHDFDVVISHMPSTYPYTLLGRPGGDSTIHIAALHNAPNFKFYSDLYPAQNKMDRYMRLVALEKADKISLLFDDFTSQMPEHYRHKCFVLPNFTEQRENVSPGAAGEHKTILSVGRLTPQKGHAALLKCYARVKEKYPDWKLHIYGEGPLKSEMQDLCETLDLSFKDIFRGTRRDIAAAYQEADIFAFPSVFEGFGLTLVEAMAFGLPSVGFADCAGVKYLIEHNKNGFLVARENEVDAIAEAIIQLIESPNLRESFGKEGIKTAKHYSVRKSIDSLETTLASFLPIKPREQKKETPASSFRTAIFITYTDGGAGNAAMRLHHGLSQKGVKARVFSFSPSDDECIYQTKITPMMEAIGSIFGPLVRDDNRLPGSTIFSPNYPSLTPEQLAFLDEFDVINIHWVARLLSNESVTYLANLGKPVIWTMHDMHPFTGGCHYASGCEKYLTDCTHCPQLRDTFNEYPAQILESKKRHLPENIVVVTPSTWLADCVRKSAVFKNNRVEVIPNSLDTEVFQPTEKEEARRTLNIPVDKKILLFICHNNNERRKGFQELIKTTEYLKKQNQPYHILIFGKESSDLGKLDMPYTALGYIADEHILALGYSAADVTVLPTLEDNLPNAILESAACGTPIVAFDSGGVGDAVINNVTGYLVPRGDCEALARKIERAACEDFRKRCRDYAVKEFSLDVQARRYQGLFEDLLNAPAVHRDEPIPLIFPETAQTQIALLATSLRTSQKHIHGYTKRIQELVSERNKFAHEELKWLEPHEELKRQKTEKDTQLKKLHKQLQQSNEQIRQQQKNNEELQLKVKQIEEHIESIRQSRSWRITRPLRAIGYFIKDNDTFWRLIREKR